MLLFTLPSGPFQTNAYVLACPITQEAAIVDPGIDSADSILQVIEENHLHPTQILLTHSHWDHIGNVAKLSEKLNIPVYIHELDAPNLETPGVDQLPMLVPFPGKKPSGYLKEGDQIAVGKTFFEVIHTPGHTPGGVCFYSKEAQILLSGDTLFKQSIGNLSFPTSEPELMWQSLKKLEKLPPETKIYPGHGSETTIGEENWLPKAKQIFGF